MSDGEDWTVVGSKSQKNGAGAGVSSSKEAPDKSCQGRNLVGVKIKKRPGGESLNAGKKDVRGAGANNQHGTCGGAMGPFKAAVGVKYEMDRASMKVQDVGSSKITLLPIKTEGAVPAPGNVDVVKSKSGCNSKSQISQKLQRSPPVPVPPVASDKDNCGNSCDKKVNQNTATGQTVAQTSTSTATTSSGGTTKKKRGGKEERRKKREEKFYQALYQNKDSHIQFVSAEVIRKLQNNDRPTVAWKTPCRTTKFTPSSFASATLAESCGAKCLLPVDDFPLLTPNKSNSAQVEDKVVTASCSGDTNKSELSTESSKIDVKGDVTATPQHNQVLSTAKTSGDSPSETPPCNVKTPPVCSSKGKKSKQPMIIDVSSLIINKKKERERDVQRKFGTSNTPFGRLGMVRRENFRVTAGNPLDSSGPGVINRGKIRQKKKKPTKLKLTILKSRALGKMLMEQQIKQEEGLESGDIKIKSDPDTSTNVIEGLSTMSLSNLPEIIDEQCAEVKVKEEKIIVESPDENTDEPVENKESVNSENDVTLKFIQLLDEVSRLKIADEGPSAEVEVAVKSCMHTRKFRDYCDMYTSKELHRHVINLLSELFRFQDRLYHTDPIKFKTKRRFVTGLKEAFTYLNLNKVQLLIIAPDIEKNPEPGGLDEKITQILTLANSKGVAYIFSSSKYNLGRPMRIKTPISIISVLDKQNCEETFKAMMEEANRLREQYRNDFMVKTKEFIAQERIKLEQ